jgi:hypothetical protein
MLSMDLDGAFVELSVDDWMQTISTDKETAPTGACIKAHCSAAKDFDLTLSTGETISQMPIDVTLLRGPLTLGDGGPLQRGVGILNYISAAGVWPRSAIGCWVGLEGDHYNEVWAQVRSGAYTRSSISFDLAPFPEPGERLWRIDGNRGSLFVLSASITFTYSRPRAPSR